MEQKIAPSISIIVVMDRNGIIGKDGSLPWHISEDLKRFKAITMGHPVIMGRKTYDSIGRPLPGRKMIIISRKAGLTVDGCEVVSTPEEAINLASHDEAFVIGGGQIYRELLPITTKLYITRVNTIVEGDTKFPEVDWKSWHLIATTKGSETNFPFTYVFEEYIRR